MNKNHVPWWKTSISESSLEKIKEAFLKENFSQGEMTREFEKQFSKKLHVPYVVATTSGSIALLMAMIAIGIKPKDEVIIPNLTFIATAHAAMMLGAKVRLVDTRNDLPIIDHTKIEEKINKRTKAIVPVHIGGRSADMREIEKIARSYDLNVIEDAAQSLYSKNESGFLGTQSKIGCFSLGMTKLISVGQGGVLVTNDKDIYEKIILIRNNGVADISKDTSVRFGLNFKFNDILASIGIEQIELIENRAERVNEIYKKYEYAIENLSTIKIIPVNIAIGEVALWVQVICRNRDNLIKYLSNNSIETRVFLPNLDSVQHISNKSNFPLSKIFSEQGLYLPCGPSQSNKDIDQVLDALKNYTEQD